MQKSTEDYPAEVAPRTRSAGATELDYVLYHASPDVLDMLFANHRLCERHLLILLSRKDLPREVLSGIAGNREWMNSYRVKLAVLKHPHTPRRVALSLLKFIYAFDLLAIALTPGVPAELRRLAEDAVLSQKGSLALGQRKSLARRGSLRIAAALLTDRDRSVIEAALSNRSLTAHSIAAALLVEHSPRALMEMIISDERWLARHPVKVALVRSRHLSLARLMGILPELSRADLADVVSDRRVAANVRLYAARMARSRTRGPHGIPDRDYNERQ